MQGLNNEGNKFYKLESHGPHLKAQGLGSQGGERKEKGVIKREFDKTNQEHG